MHRFIVTLLADLCLVALATIGAVAFRDNLELSPARIEAMWPYLCASLVVSLPIFLALGLNRSIWRMSSAGDYLRVAVASMLIVLSATSVSFLVNRLDGVARALPPLQLILMILLLAGTRVLVRLRHGNRRRAPLLLAPGREDARRPETVLVLGINRVCELYLQALDELAEDRIVVAGLIGGNERHTGRVVQRHAVLGTPEQIGDVLRDLEVHGISVDRIVVTTATGRLSQAARDALCRLERSSSIEVDFFAERIGVIARRAGGAAASTTALSIRAEAATKAPGSEAVFSFAAGDLTQISRRPYWRAKRLFDVILSAVLIVLLSPVALLVGALAAFDVGMPIVFWQQRLGLGGRPFRLLKVRTMAAPHDADGNRLSDDERVSAIGRFLRRSRLDELPQLFHILRGQMSFVGPRPLLAGEQPDASSARLLVRPGLTGWAQVKGGRGISMTDKAALDVWYVRNASLRLDLEIALRTVPIVLFGERVDAMSIQKAWHELLAAGICRPMHYGNGSSEAVQQVRKSA